MTIGESPLSLERPVEDVATDEEHGCFLVVLFQEVVEGIVRAVRAIVEAVAHAHGFWDGGNIGRKTSKFWSRALMVCPPCSTKRMTRQLCSV